MELNLKWFGVLALSFVVIASCNKPEAPKEDGKDTKPQDEVTVPDKQEVRH